MYELTLTKIKRILDKADQIIAVFLLGAVIAVTPLYCSAAVIKAHTHARDVPMLSKVSMAVLQHAMPVKLRPMEMHVPAPLPRRHK